MSLSKTITSEAAKAAPPIGVSAAALAGMSVSDWVAVATLVYVLLQIGLMVPKYRCAFWAEKDCSHECRTEE